ncbi:MAG: hypothetical protein WCA47_01820 [Terriglobales bacterium]
MLDSTRLYALARTLAGGRREDPILSFSRNSCTYQRVPLLQCSLSQSRRLLNSRPSASSARNFGE